MSSCDAVNLSLGILGVLALIPILTKFIKNRLPAAQLRYLDDIITQTEGFLLSLEEQGTFRDPMTAFYFRERLANVRHAAELRRMRTYCATLLWQQIECMCNGLSKKLSDLGAVALKLRAKISATATEELTIVTFMLHPNDRQATSPNSGIGVSLIDEETPPILTYARHTKRFLASRGISSASVTQLEHGKNSVRKNGVMRSDDVKRVLRTARTSDSVSSSSTCVSQPESLRTQHVKLMEDESMRESEGYTPNVELDLTA